jgi:outer membrane protein insertion porin family
VALLLLVVALAPGCGGRRPVSELRESLHRVRSIEFEGNTRFSDGHLRSLMTMKEPGLTRPFRRSYYFRDLLLKDLSDVRDHYRDHGYLDLQVASLDEDFDDESGSVALTITLDEGSVTLVDTMAYEGATVFDRNALDEITRLEEGRPYSPFVSRGDAERVRNAYLDRGYLLVDVRLREDVLEAGASVTYVIDEGQPTRLRYLDASGNQHTQRKYIIREVGVSRGEVLTRGDIHRTRRRLSRLGLFSVIRALPVVVDSATVDLEIEVRERKHGFYGFGFGFTSDERVRLSGEWGHRNVWGTARRVQTSVAVGWDVEDITSGRRVVDTERDIRATWVEPWIFGTRNEAILGVYHELIEDPSSPRYITNGLSATLRREISEFVDLFLTFENEWVQSNDQTLTDSDFTKQSVRLEGERDARDNILDPRRGSIQRTSVQYSRLEGSYDYLKSLVSTSNALPRNRERTRLVAFRLQTGYISPVSEPGGDFLGEIPYTDRFFIGGATTLRGYDREQLGPLDENGITRGGTVLFLANVEYRFPLWWRFAGGLFLDAGNVWSDVAEVKLERVVGSFWGDYSPLDVRYGLGAGLRLGTPVGPLRLDYGRKLGETDEAPFDRGWELHLSLGHAF